ncbi:MAG: hypothetical protein WBA18_12760 [Terracidiphilus sp.]
MKVAIRVFALLVAFVGLTSASFSSSATKTLPAHVSNSAIDPNPGPLTLPYPLPCQSDGSCVAPAQ